MQRKLQRKFHRTAGLLHNTVKHYSLDLMDDLNGTDKGSIHSYLRHLYEPILNISIPSKLLEIGIFRGASLALWKLALPQCEVIGVDIDTSNIKNAKALDLLDNNLIKIIDCNAYQSPSTLSSLGTFDLIIDDGPHTVTTQIAALAFVKQLSEMGTLVIEDINLRDPEVDQLFAEIYSLQGISLGILNFVHKKGRFDDVAAIFTKNEHVANWLEIRNNYFSNKLIRSSFGRNIVLKYSVFPQMWHKFLRFVKRNGLG